MIPGCPLKILNNRKPPPPPRRQADGPDSRHGALCPGRRSQPAELRIALSYDPAPAENHTHVSTI